jgi:hypothetical protein
MKLKNTNMSIRAFYAMLILIVIVAGILSRKVPGVPLIVGDMLYAVMMYLIVRFMLIRLNYWKTGIISLSICCLIELSQLCTAPWINQLRNNNLGALVLGHGFLWSDIAAYTIGTVICVIVNAMRSQ